MKVKTFNGREVYWKPKPIEWEGKSPSDLQKGCKQVLAQYWMGDVVAEEQTIPSSILRFDFVNFTKKIIVEVDGQQHAAFNKFFHDKNIFNFVKSKQRDEKKNKFAEINGFKMWRVKNKTELQKILVGE